MILIFFLYFCSFIFVLFYLTNKDITQLDNHLPTLTVSETLQFSSNCIVPEELSSPEADQQRVNVSSFLLHFLLLFSLSSLIDFSYYSKFCVWKNVETLSWEANSFVG